MRVQVQEPHDHPSEIIRRLPVRGKKAELVSRLADSLVSDDAGGDSGGGRVCRGGGTGGGVAAGGGGGIDGDPMVVSSGSIGKITNTSPYEVDWSPHPAGNRPVVAGQFVKCALHEFWIKGDVVKASRDLHYVDCAADPWVRKGSIGRITQAREPCVVEQSSVEHCFCELELKVARSGDALATSCATSTPANHPCCHPYCHPCCRTCCHPLLQLLLPPLLRPLLPPLPPPHRPANT